MKKNDIWISLAIITAAGLVLLFYTQRKGFVGIDAGGADTVLELNSSWIAQTTITSAVEPAKIGARIYRPKILSLSMKQGGDTCRQYLWQVPKDFKGKYQVLIDIDLGPFQAKQNENWRSI